MYADVVTKYKRIVSASELMGEITISRSGVGQHTYKYSKRRMEALRDVLIKLYLEYRAVPDFTREFIFGVDPYKEVANAK